MALVGEGHARPCPRTRSMLWKRPNGNHRFRGHGPLLHHHGYGYGSWMLDRRRAPWLRKRWMRADT